MLESMPPLRYVPTGTSLRIWPNKKYFDSPKISMPDLERIEEMISEETSVLAE